MSTTAWVLGAVGGAVAVGVAGVLIARSTSAAPPSGQRCSTFTVKRRRKGEPVLPPSQWKQVTRCSGHKLSASSGKRCRAGGPGWRAIVRQNFASMRPRTKAQRLRALAPAVFVRCS